MTTKKKLDSRKGDPPSKRNARGEPLDKRGEVARISMQTYNALTKAYFETQNVTEAARLAGTSRATARYYIDGPGRPKDGMLNIRERWLAVQAAAQEEEELTLLAFQRGEMKFARRALSAVRGEFELAIADVSRRLASYKADPKTAPSRELNLMKAIEAYERISRHIEHLLGASDQTITHRAADPLDDLDDAEAIAYATRGILPASMRQSALGTGKGGAKS
jgi:hypothetical protein